MSMRFTLVAALAAALLPGMRAEAQQITSPFRYVEEKQALSPFAGAIRADRGALGMGPEAGTIYGLRYNIQVTGPVTLELEAGYFPSTRTVYRAIELPEGDTATTAPTRQPVRTTDLTLVEALVAMRFNLTGQRTWHGVMPYLAFGGGGAFEVAGDDRANDGVPSTEIFDFGTSFAGVLGVGMEWFASRRMTVRADVRDLLWKLETPEAFLGTDVPESEWTQNVVLSAGVAVRF